MSTNWYSVSPAELGGSAQTRIAATEVPTSSSPGPAAACRMRRPRESISASEDSMKNAGVPK